MHRTSVRSQLFDDLKVIFVGDALTSNPALKSEFEELAERTKVIVLHICIVIAPRSRDLPIFTDHSEFFWAAFVLRMNSRYDLLLSIFL